MTEPTQPPRAFKSPLLRAPHGFFTRLGGVSDGLYASLQTGFGAKADPREAVEANRARALAAVGLTERVLVTPHQTHSADALAIGADWDPATPAPRVDGLATRAPGVAIGALAADCMPVLMEDAAAGVVGACHAGWRGALAGVVEATIETMLTLGADRGRIAAAIGPCIGPGAYEVGPEFVDAFLADDPSNAAFFGPPAPGRPADRRRFDMPGYLIKGRAPLPQMAWTGLCTYSDPGRFFSCRRSVHRGESDYGRLISIIAPPAASAGS